MTPVDLITEENWERVLFTSYALSLSFFESRLLKERIVRNGCRFIDVLVDVEEPGKHDFQAVAVGIYEFGKENYDDAFGASFRALLLISNCSPLLSGDEHLCALIGRGGSVRVSVQYWIEIVKRIKSQPMKQVLEFFFSNLIISQHFAVATNRFDGKTSRLRLALDENGIESLVSPKPWYPRITPDGLDALLSVMTSCGMLEQDADGGFTLRE